MSRVQLYMRVSRGLVCGLGDKKGAKHGICRVVDGTEACTINNTELRRRRARGADSNILNWDTFSVHLNKRHVPQIAAILRNISQAAQHRMHAAQRRYKRAFVWWRPDGLAYEYTLASLGQRVQALGLDKE